MVLQSLQATLDKLNTDGHRHKELTETLNARMALSQKVTRRQHKKHTFAESGYVFMHLLGEGRFGMVKLAKKKSTKQVQHNSSARRESRRATQGTDMSMVAIRVIMRRRAGVGRASVHDNQARLLSLKESHQTLMKTAEALKSLDHPGIVRVLETFEDDQCIYIVMEYCAGGHLLQAAGSGMDELKAAHYVNEVVGAIAHAHENNIVHQDLRPENILFSTADPDARLVICDWSNAEFIDAPPEESRRGLITSDYSAPELRPEVRTDRVDMWSIGMVAYVLLTMQPPMRRPQDFGPQMLPRSAHLSEPCVDFLSKLLRVDPNQRMSARQAQAHPWLANARNMEKPVLPKFETLAAARRSIVSFGTKDTLQRAAATFISKHLSGEALHELTLAFQAADKNSDGTLDRFELMDLLRPKLEKAETAGDGPSNDEMEMEAILSAMAAMDSDGSGVVTYSEFLAAASSSVLNQSVHLAWEAFRVFDGDGSGRLSRNEIYEFLQTDTMGDMLGGIAASRGGSSREEVLEQIKTKYDKNGDNAISFDEFMEIVMSD
eukprot:TRINITY_DN72723_c0_g1_i1.p1 TRINITY_DN72723_c0_g1~~TRINITY_DN72723_c0_g1_i1.p1  ORF type:complete len:548 (+),score=115.84 TRINITY_DN72723_c0_g1_i1:33-1676(+)